MKVPTNRVGELDQVFVTVDASIGQDGGLRLCEVLSSYLYDELDADRAAIDVQSFDGSFYVSRFNDTADCQ